MSIKSLNVLNKKCIQPATNYLCFRKVSKVKNMHYETNYSRHSIATLTTQKGSYIKAIKYSRLLKPRVIYLPGSRLKCNSKSLLIENSTYIKDLAYLESESYINNIKCYLSEVVGVFSKRGYSEILKPKVSTASTVAGVSRDKGRSILTKLANQFNRSGKQRTAIKNLNDAFILAHFSLKMDRSTDTFISLSNAFNQLRYLNPAFSKMPFPFITKLLDYVNHATPKFCIKRHLNKGHGRRKKSKKGLPKLRSYLAFLKPHGRRIMSFKWLMLDYHRLSTGYKFKISLSTFIINTLMGIEGGDAVNRKIELYKEVVSYLRKRN